MDFHPFMGLERMGYDIAVVYNYRDFHLDSNFCREYSEVCVIAWSFGVYAANITLDVYGDKLTRRIAVCGSHLPVDDNFGIPRAMFDATLNNLSDSSLLKFYRRVCGSAKNYNAFMQTAPKRDINELRQELEAFSALPLRPVANWDCALLAERDAIFPLANLQKAWEGTHVIVLDEAHMPNFQHIIDSYVIDKNLLTQRFHKQRHTYEAEAFIQSSIAKGLIDRILDINPFFNKILEIGCGSGFLSRLIADCYPEASITFWDICPTPPTGIDAHKFVCCDAELAITSCNSEVYDLIISASTIQWFNSPARFIRNCYATLKPGGILAFSTFVHGNMAEISECTGHSLPLPDFQGWLSMCTDFEILFAEESFHQLSFDRPMDVFRHLKNTGVNSLNRSGFIRNAIAKYPLTDEKAKLTYRPAIFILKKK